MKDWSKIAQNMDIDDYCIVESKDESKALQSALKAIGYGSSARYLYGDKFRVRKIYREIFAKKVENEEYSH